VGSGGAAVARAAVAIAPAAASAATEAGSLRLGRVLLEPLGPVALIGTRILDLLNLLDVRRAVRSARRSGALITTRRTRQRLVRTSRAVMGVWARAAAVAAAAAAASGGSASAEEGRLCLRHLCPLFFGLARRVRIDFTDDAGKPTGKYYYQVHVVVMDARQIVES
jgi:hypothetical protein